MHERGDDEMIQMEYPKLPLEGLPVEAQIKALKRQVDILTDNLQIVLNSIEMDTSNVDNTSDKDKPISDATQKALDDIEEQIADTNAILDGKVSKSGDTMSGDLNFAKGKYLMSNGKIVAGVSTTDTYMFGYGSRNSGEGASYFDGDTVNIRSNKEVNITAPEGVNNSGAYNALYKITDTVISVPAGDAGADSSLWKAYPLQNAVSGYRAVGIVGYASQASVVFPFASFVYNGTHVSTGFIRTATTSQAYNITFKVLWLKATSA